MTSTAPHQPEIRELSASDLDLVSGGADGYNPLIAAQQIKAQAGSFSGQSDISSSYAKNLKALVANVRG